MASDDGLETLTREELLDLARDMRDDFETLNGILNTHATMFGWCHEYEERLAAHNDALKVFTVRGRVSEGTRIAPRNVYAARRIIMAQVVSTLQQYGIELPGESWAGVVRDHRALAAAHEKLLSHLKAEKPVDPE